MALLSSLFGAASQAAAAPAERSAPALAKADDQVTLRLARAFRSAGDPRSAISLYRSLGTRKSGGADLQIELGDTLLEAGLVDDAIGVYSAVPAGSETAADAQLGLARVQLRLNQPAKALEFAERGAAIAPANERVHVARGVALDRLGRHAEAQASYHAALALEPRSIVARTDLALSLALDRRFDEAIEIMSPIARSADATPRDRQNLAFVYGLKGDRDAQLTLSRVDLDEATAQANARFFEFARRPAK